MECSGRDDAHSREIHGLAGRAPELRAVLGEHAERLTAASGSLGATAYQPLAAEPGEFVLDAWWRDEASLRAHYATPAYTRYVGFVSELLARPSDVTVYAIARSYRAVGNVSIDPARQG